MSGSKRSRGENMIRLVVERKKTDILTGNKKSQYNIINLNIVSCLDFILCSLFISSN
jgi:hypothetical protein